MRLVPNCVDENFYTYVKVMNPNLILEWWEYSIIERFLRGLQILQKLLVVDDDIDYLFMEKPEAESG